ncbi:MAG: hypothetical protein EBU42_07710, partial [Synechococcus sp.]|nr:hypothetical protein [Synechococcus sp.]
MVVANHLLITGPSRGGKSEWAEQRIREMAGAAAITYLATGPTLPDDAAWQQRLSRHRQRRPEHWRLLEASSISAVSQLLQQGKEKIAPPLRLQSFDREQGPRAVAQTCVDGLGQAVLNGGPHRKGIPFPHRDRHATAGCGGEDIRCLGDPPLIAAQGLSIRKTHLQWSPEQQKQAAGTVQLPLASFQQQAEQQ